MYTQLSVPRSKYIDGSSVCLYDLHDIGCFRAANFNDSLYTLTELFSSTLVIW